MKSNSDSFDWLKKTLAEQDIDFMDSDWEAAKALIEKENGKRKKRFFPIFWLGGDLLLISICFVFLYLSMNHVNSICIKNEGISVNQTMRSLDTEGDISSPMGAGSNLTPPPNSSPLSTNTSTPTKRSNIGKTSSVEKGIPTRQGAISTYFAPSSPASEPEAIHSHEIISKAPIVLDSPPISEGAPHTKRLFSISDSITKVSYPILSTPAPTKERQFHAPSSPLLAISKPLSIIGYVGVGQGYKESLKAMPYMGVSVEYPVTQHVIIRGIGELSGRRGSFSERTNISMTDAVADFNGLAIPSQYSHVLVRESIYRSELYYGALGIGVGIPLRKHTFRADVAYHHLIGTKSKRVQEVTSGTEFNAKAVQTITSFKEGVNPHDIVFSIGYQFAFSKRAAVEIQGHYGLLDMSKNSFYESSSKHHSLQMRTGIRYRFY